MPVDYTDPNANAGGTYGATPPNAFGNDGSNPALGAPIANPDAGADDPGLPTNVAGLNSTSGPFGGLAQTGVVPTFGGAWGAPETIANSLSAEAQAAQTRQGPQIQAPTGPNLASHAALAQAQSAYANAAAGNAPSAATIGMGSALSSNLADAYAHARTGGFVGSAGGLGGADSSAVAAGGSGRANEIGAARAGLANASGAMTGADIAGLSADNNVALTQAQLDQQNQQANDATTLGLQGMANSTLLAQLSADTSLNAGKISGNAGLAAQQIGISAANQANAIGAGFGGAGGIAGGMGSTIKDSGGLMAQGSTTDPSADSNFTTDDSDIGIGDADPFSDMRLKYGIRPANLADAYAGKV